MDLAELIPARPDWMARAACRGADPELFFPKNGREAQVTAKYVKATYCNPCPVRNECLQEAVANCELIGIWGGLAPKERRVHRRAYVRGTHA